MEIPRFGLIRYQAIDISIMIIHNFTAHLAKTFVSMSLICRMLPFYNTMPFWADLVSILNNGNGDGGFDKRNKLFFVLPV